MGECLKLATVRACGALLITQEADVQGLAGVRWLPKAPG